MGGGEGRQASETSMSRSICAQSRTADGIGARFLVLRGAISGEKREEDGDRATKNKGGDKKKNRKMNKEKAAEQDGRLAAGLSK